MLKHTRRYLLYVCCVSQITGNSTSHKFQETPEMVDIFVLIIRHYINVTHLISCSIFMLTYHDHHHAALISSTNVTSNQAVVPFAAEKIRVGRDYQAVCPELEPVEARKPETINDRALLVWSPTADISDLKCKFNNKYLL